MIDLIAVCLAVATVSLAVVLFIIVMLTYLYVHLKVKGNADNVSGVSPYWSAGDNKDYHQSQARIE